jgi:hypothetical protein
MYTAALISPPAKSNIPSVVPSVLRSDGSQMEPNLRCMTVVQDGGTEAENLCDRWNACVRSRIFEENRLQVTRNSSKGSPLFCSSELMLAQVSTNFECTTIYSSQKAVGMALVAESSPKQTTSFHRFSIG